jgi:hypothetical protein
MNGLDALAAVGILALALLAWSLLTPMEPPPLVTPIPTATP